MTWLDDYEATFNRRREDLRLTDEMPDERMARVIREQSAVLRKTNPWRCVVCTTDDICYECQYCHMVVNYRDRETLSESHTTDCVWRNLSPDAKEVINDTTASRST